MTSKSRSLVSRPLSEDILPLSTGEKIKPGQSYQIKAGAWTDNGFLPNRLVIANPAADWVVNDIKIGGQSQFCRSGDIPGDMFNSQAAKIQFDVVKPGADVDLVVTYTGSEQDGARLYAAMVGSEYDPGLLEIVWGACLARSSQQRNASRPAS